MDGSLSRISLVKLASARNGPKLFICMQQLIWRVAICPLPVAIERCLVWRESTSGASAQAPAGSLAALGTGSPRPLGRVWQTRFDPRRSQVATAGRRFGLIPGSCGQRRGLVGGAERSRTADLLNAIQATLVSVGIGRDRKRQGFPPLSAFTCAQRYRIVSCWTTPNMCRVLSSLLSGGALEDENEADRAGDCPAQAPGERQARRIRRQDAPKAYSCSDHPQRSVESVAHVELRSERGVGVAVEHLERDAACEVVRPDRDHVGRQFNNGGVARPGWTASLW